MIWSEVRNFCFIHIPKTGGTAIAGAYVPVAKFSDVILGGYELGEMLQVVYQKRWGVHKHANAAMVAKVVGPDRFANAFSFAVIRDPLERLMSFYRWMRHPGITPHLGEENKRLIQFDDFAEFIQHAQSSFSPQANFVQNNEGKLIVSKLLRFETLSAEWTNIARRLEAAPSLPIENKSPPISIAVSQGAVDFVRQYYANDYKLIDAYFGKKAKGVDAANGAIPILSQPLENLQNTNHEDGSLAPSIE